MAFSLTWLPDVLKRAGLKVSLVPGWENRGRGDVRRILGVICHHTVGPKTGNMPSLNTLINGRPGLSGPLAQLGLGRDGTFYVIAAGRANHAGIGSFKGMNNNGNANYIGIEAENTGTENDFPYPEIQMEAYRHGAAAILKHINQDVEFCLGHKEYAGRRKIDPLFDMKDFRKEVASIMAGNIPSPTPIPSVEPTTNGGVPRATLRRGMTGPLTRMVQLKLRITADGIFGAKTEAAIRQFQRQNQLVPDGIVGPKTWKMLDNIK